MAEVLSQEVMYEKEEKLFRTARGVSLLPQDTETSDQKCIHVQYSLRQPNSVLCAVLRV